MPPEALAQDTLAGWPASAVRDTVRAITEDAAYDRTLTRSLLEQFLDWIAGLVARALRLLPEVGVGRWVLIVLAVALAVLVVARVVMAMRAQREFRAGDARGPRAARRLDPWTEAERLASGGAYLEAAHALCAALLSASARRGEVVLHPSKTTGDYAREMRRRGAPSLRAFQGFRDRYDRVVYDAQRCSADEYAMLVAAARPLLGEERAA